MILCYILKAHAHLASFHFFQALKVLHNSTEFLPHVIFLCPPPVETNYNIITTAPDLENGKPCQNIELAVSQSWRPLTVMNIMKRVRDFLFECCADLVAL